MSSPYILFNEQANNFFKHFIEGLPDTPNYVNIRKEFTSLKSGFNLVKSYDETKPQKLFSEYILSKYRTHIETEDDTFFIETDEFEITSARKEYWMDFIGQIKILWKEMDDDSKKNVWKYFKLLLFLNDQCCGQ